VNGTAKKILIFSGTEGGTGPALGAASSEEEIHRGRRDTFPTTEKGRMDLFPRRYWRQYGHFRRRLQGEVLACDDSRSARAVPGLAVRGRERKPSAALQAR